MDLGSSVCSLGGIGRAHYFHSTNVDPDEANRVIDDRETSYILWPNYHSGSNGDFQEIVLKKSERETLVRCNGRHESTARTV